MAASTCVSSGMHPRRRLVWPLFGASIIAGMDQAVKLVVVGLRPRLSVIPGLFAISFRTNTGTAFGLLQEIPMTLTLVGLFMLLGLLIYLPRASRAGNPWEPTALALIIGGVTGNLIDRLRWGYVVDYLDVFIGTYHWPTFNLADIAISAGVGLLLLEVLWGRRATRQAAHSRGESHDERVSTH
jgi:signal peptidase II